MFPVSYGGIAKVIYKKAQKVLVVDRWHACFYIEFFSNCESLISADRSMRLCAYAFNRHSRIDRHTWGGVTSLFLPYLWSTPCCGDKKHCHYVRLYKLMDDVSFWVIFVVPCKRSSKKAEQNTSYFITFTLGNLYLQHGGRNTENR